MSNQSENIDKLSKALSLAQGELRPSYKTKTVAFNKVEYKYSTLANDWNSCREALCKNELAVFQTLEPFNDKWVIITTLSHSSGQWIRSILPITIGAPKDLASNITYMRRYSLSAIVGIAPEDEDDDGQQANQEYEKNQNIQKRDDALKIDSNEINELVEITNQLNRENMDSFIKWIKEKYECSLNTLPKAAFGTCLTLLSAKLKRQNDSTQEKVA